MLNTYKSASKNRWKNQFDVEYPNYPHIYRPLFIPESYSLHDTLNSIQNSNKYANDIIKPESK